MKNIAQKRDRKVVKFARDSGIRAERMEKEMKEFLWAQLLNFRRQNNYRKKFTLMHAVSSWFKCFEIFGDCR
jgi:hypothetical protein